MVEEVHRKFTPNEKKQLPGKRVDEVANWLAGLREQAEGGGITWEQFDSLVARAMVARERYGVWMKTHSLLDNKTGLPNFRWWNFELQREIEESKRSKKPLGVLMVDLDHLKRINDKYGHPIGDKVLEAVAGQIKKNIRAEDFCARYGGEEFGVLVIDPKENTLGELAERLRRSVEEIDTEGIPTVTISVGGTLYKEGEDVVKRADKALYASKDKGRNRFTIL